jgi:phosphoribosylformylglycinamidine synthase subunit PurQ / glutaminase
VSPARVAVLQFPGVNCESETVRALERVGLEGELFRWTRPAAELRDYDAFVLPGGFAYQDRVRAGALAAKDPMVEVLGEEAEAGKPVLGICNGAQVLVESGLVPRRSRVELALARNRMPRRSGYHARWIYVRVEASPCVWTRHLKRGTLLPLQVGHGEGRFVSQERGRITGLKRGGQAPLVYATPEGKVARRFPDNPNGSEGAVAAICNERGNVLAMMPHPDRAQSLGALPPGVAGEWAEARERARTAEPQGFGDHAGPGLALFDGLKRYLEAAS